MAGERIELWERQLWDTDLSFEVFSIWLMQDLPRNLDAAWRTYKDQERTPSGALVRAPSYIRAMHDGMMQSQLAGEYEQVSWEDRARLFDIEQQRIDIIKWAEKKKEVRREEWDIAKLMIQKAKLMLEWPIEEMYLEDYEIEGQNVPHVVIKPAKWGVRDISAMAKIASELLRLSAEMSQGKYEVEFTFNLSPQALEALRVLERHGLSVSEAVSQFEQILIEAATEYVDK
jgi:hypothetical protein